MEKIISKKLSDIFSHREVKSIINGKTYNLDTAEEIATWSNYEFSDVEDTITESLYKTNDGDFFLYVRGGIRSCYGYFNEYYLSPMKGSIVPFSNESTQKWLAIHSFVDEYIELFGEVEE